MDKERTNPPKGFLRWFMRMPVFLARIGLSGWERLAGLQWMLLITTGRVSGKKRYAMVDVLLHDNRTDTYYIESGFGNRSDWYRNIRANPVFEARVGRRTFTATATPVPAGDAANILLDFIKEKPAYARQVFKLVGVTDISEQHVRELSTGMLLLAIRPQ